MPETQPKSSDGNPDAALGLLSQSKIESIKQTVKPTAPTEKVVEVTTNNTPAEQPEKVVKPVEPKVEANAFGLSVTPSTTITLTSFADVQKFAEENGLAVKEVNDLVEIIKRAKTNEEANQKLQTLQSNNDRYESVITGLPREVALVFDAAISNGDWKGVISKIAKSSSFDYSKSFDLYDELNMVNRYNDDTFTEEEFKELDPKIKNTLVKYAKSGYAQEQAEVQSIQTVNESKKKEFESKFNHSVEQSLHRLKEAYPSMDNTRIARVQEIMARDLTSTLFNADGTYRPEAAMRIAMQEYGQETIQSQMNTIGDFVNRARSEENGKTAESILMRSDKPNLGGKTSPDRKNLIQDQASKAVSFIKAR
jgi:hypothetical protein